MAEPTFDPVFTEIIKAAVNTVARSTFDLLREKFSHSDIKTQISDDTRTSLETYYDQETFDDEQAILRQMMRLKAELLPKLRPLLDNQIYQQLNEEIDQLAINHAGLIQGFGEYLEPMNTAVDEIKSMLDAVPTAIAKKLAFELQISPGLRQSKELLRRISAGIGRVQAA